MRVPLARSKAPIAAPPAGRAAPCTNCAAPMDVGQDWCLACGTAVPGRLGGGPGLRSSLGVVGVTLLLVVGAVAAAYAALNSQSRQATQTVASTPAAQTPVSPDVPAGTATVPSVPVAPGIATVPPAVTPTTVTPTTPKLPPVTPTPAAAPTSPTAPVTVTPTTKTTPTSAATTPTTTTPAAKSATILLDTDAAATYNPYGLPTASFSDPAKAIDGDTTTSWTYQLDPGTAGKTLFGLAINLKSKQKVRALDFATTTPGMTVEFYGATGAEPVSITDPAWIHLANRRQIKASTSISLKGGGKAFDYLLVWITHAPAGMTQGTLGVSELSVST
jgi:hypothetical protein